MINFIEATFKET